MTERKGLGALLVAELALITAIPDVPRGGELQNFESWISYCSSCVNRQEGRCLTTGAERFPSGACENYEPNDGTDTYNVTFGPMPENVNANLIKIHKTRPELGYREVVCSA